MLTLKVEIAAADVVWRGSKEKSGKNYSGFRKLKKWPRTKTTNNYTADHKIHAEIFPVFPLNCWLDLREVPIGDRMPLPRYKDIHSVLICHSQSRLHRGNLSTNVACSFATFLHLHVYLAFRHTNNVPVDTLIMWCHAMIILFCWIPFTSIKIYILLKMLETILKPHHLSLALANCVVVTSNYTPCCVWYWRGGGTRELGQKWKVLRDKQRLCLFNYARSRETSKLIAF